jgi:hypothetical protein
MKRVRIIQRRPAGPDHAVNTVTGGDGLYRRRPCSDCPWRLDAVGKFPAEAFRHSAKTAMDGAALATQEDLEEACHGFACHQSGSEKPATCAGYILQACDAIGWRINVIKGRFDPRDVTSGGARLFANYHAMAVANGVAPDDPALTGLRRQGETMEQEVERIKSLRARSTAE